MNLTRRLHQPLALVVAAVEGLIAAAFALAPHGPWPVDGALIEAAGRDSDNGLTNGRRCDEQRFSPPVAGSREG